MLKPALVIIDCQYDFLPKGALAVPNGDQVLPKIEELLHFQKFPWLAVAITQDWHPRDHCLFASNNGVEPYSELDFDHPLKEKNCATGQVKTAKQTVWPDHCIQESHGAALEEGLKKEIDSKIVDKVPTAFVKKGYLQDREYYLCFSDIWKLHLTELSQFLIENSITDVVFVGLAYDFCVLHSAIDSVNAGFSTYVIKECSKPVFPDQIDNTDSQYRDAGVNIVQTNHELVKTIQKANN